MLDDCREDTTPATTLAILPGSSIDDPALLLAGTTLCQFKGQHGTVRYGTRPVPGIDVVWRNVGEDLSSIIELCQNLGYPLKLLEDQL